MNDNAPPSSIWPGNLALAALAGKPQVWVDGYREGWSLQAGEYHCDLPNERRRGVLGRRYVKESLSYGWAQAHTIGEYANLRVQAYEGFNTGWDDRERSGQ